MGKCNGSFIDIYMYMYTSLWCHVNYKFYIYCCSYLPTIIMCCRMKLMLLSGRKENLSPLSQVRSYIRTDEKGYDAQYPTSHYYWILWHIRFRLSISGNSGSKLHCGYGNIVNTPFLLYTLPGQSFLLVIGIAILWLVTCVCQDSNAKHKQKWLTM